MTFCKFWQIFDDFLQILADILYNNSISVLMLCMLGQNFSRIFSIFFLPKTGKDISCKFSPS